MTTESSRVAPTISRTIPFSLFLTGGVLVFLFGSNTYTTFPTNRNALFDWGITIAFFALSAVLHRSARFHPLWQVAFALFTVSFANALNLFLGNWLGSLFTPPGSFAEKIAVDKLSQAIPVILSLILLTRLSGSSPGTIFIKRGNLRQGLTFGLVSFGVCVMIFAIIAVLQASAPASRGLIATGIDLNTIRSAVPWILIFIFANGMMEELWFRGIPLAGLNSLLGPALSIVVTSIVFGALHLGATYITPGERFVFFFITLCLGLVNGYVMQKTGSIWGSVLFHAGYDLFVIIPIMASQG